jgi:hypothetical protein
MVKMVLTVLVLLIFLPSTGLKGQANDQELMILSRMRNLDTTYQAIRSMVMNYVSTYPDDSLNTVQRFAKKFGRWDFVWGARVDSNDRFDTWLSMNNTTFCNTEFCEQGGNWIQEGPLNHINASGYPSVIDQSGRVTEINARKDANGNITEIFIGTPGSGLWKGTNNGQGQYTWLNLTDASRLGISGITSIVLHPTNPNIIYASMGRDIDGGTNFTTGVIKSIDGGLTWQISLCNDEYYHLPFSKLLMHPSNPNILYAFGGKKAYRTNDGGTNWTVIFDYQLSYQNDARPWVSAPAASWPLGIVDAQFHPTNPQLIYLSTAGAWQANFFTHGSHVFCLRDPSNNSNNVSHLLVTPLVQSSLIPSLLSNGYQGAPHSVGYFEDFSIGVSPAHPNHIYLFAYLALVPGGPESIFKLEVDPVTGAVVTPGPHVNIVGASRPGLWAGFPNSSIALSPIDPNIGYSGSLSISPFIARRTTNLNASSSINFANINATSATGLTFHADCRKIFIVNATPGGAGDQLLIGTDGGINLATRTPSGSWDLKSLTGNMVLTQSYDVAVSQHDANVVQFGTLDNSTYVRDAGGQWYNVLAGDGGYNIIDWENRNVTYGEQNGTLRRINLPNAGGVPTNASVSNLNSGTGFAPYKLQQDYYSNSRLVYYKSQTANAGRLVSYNLTTAQNTVMASFPGQEVGCFEVVDKGDFYVSMRWGYSGTCQANGKKLYRQVAGVLENITCNLPALKWYEVMDIEVDPSNSSHIFVSMSGFQCTNGNMVGFNNNGAARVFESYDKGDTWQDISAGLPCYPALSMAYHDVYKILYVGTDVGVYYRNLRDIQGTFMCFGSGMPITPVNDLEINHICGRLYASTFGRGVWSSTLAPETFVQGSIQPLYSGLNTVRVFRGKSLYLGSSIQITQGKTLAIEGKLNMAQGKEVMIDYGAQLDVSGGRATGACGGTWEGFRVAGNALGITLNGTAVPHGRAMFTNAEVSRAKIAVQNYYNINFWPSRGGEVIALNSVFLNNERDWFIVNGNTLATTQISARNTSFEYNNQTPWANPSDRVYLNGVKNAVFNGCDFENLRNQAAPNVAGIYALGSSFSVGNFTLPNGVVRRSWFNRLHYGIRSTNTGSPTLTFKVNNSDFVRNLYGIHVVNTENFLVLNSNFSIGGYNYNQIFNTGLAIEGSNMFFVENNDFMGFGPSAFPYSFGTVISNTGGNTKKVFRCDFNNLFIANQAQGNNRATAPLNSGLLYSCSNHSGNDYDIYVAAQPQNVLNLGIQEHQRNSPTSNTAAYVIFSRNGNALSDFNNTVATMPAVKYYYSSSNTQTQPLDYSTGTVQLNAGSDNLSVCDPEEAFIQGPPVEFQAEKANHKAGLNTADAQLYTLEYLYASLIDGGNTQELVDGVNGGWNDDAWRMRNELLAKSPNLSLKTLREAAYSGVLPHALLMEVLLANPGVYKDDALLKDLLNDIPNPLPQALVDLLIGAQEPQTLRKQLENQINESSVLVDYHASMLAWIYLQDSIVQEDSVLYYVEKLQSPESAYNVALAKLQNQGLNAAMQYLNQVPELYDELGTNKGYMAEHLAMSQLLPILAQVMADSSGTMESIEASESLINQLAEGEYGTKSRVLAKVLQELAGGEQYDIQPVLPSNSSQYRQVQDPLQSLGEYFTRLNAYPLPAGDILNLDYELPPYTQEGYIVISDLSGKTLANIPLQTLPKGLGYWDTRSAGNGLYLCKVYADGRLLQVAKVTVMK